MPATATQDPLASMPDTLASMPDTLATKPAPRPQGKRLDSPSSEEIVQQEAGIHPFADPVSQTLAGPLRAIWGMIRSPYDLFQASQMKPRSGEEMGAFVGGGPMGLMLDRMFLHPAIQAHQTGTELRDRARTTRSVAQNLEIAANNPQQLAALREQYPQYNLATPEKARKVAGDINRNAISLFAQSLPAELGALPILGPMGQQAGARMAAGDIP